MILRDFETIIADRVGEELTVGGFAHSVRDHGGLIFIDLRSETTLLQCVVDPAKNAEIFKRAESIGSEYVLKLTGTLMERAADLVNPAITTGAVELHVSDLEIVAAAKTPPFLVSENNAANLPNEEVRLAHRYLDLRRESVKEIFTKRHALLHDVRSWFHREGFYDIATPILANSSPEGARDYLVPSRLHPGTFYALPQAPQQFKQLLMVGGFNKYFQIAPCFRDEDPRADRLVGDFYQIDSEIAWADEEEIYALCNRMITEIFAQQTDKELMDAEMVRIDYADAMERYGSDKPDMRYDLAWQDARDVFKGCGFEVFAKLADTPTARVQALHIKDACDKFTRSDLDRIQNIGRDFGLPGIAYIQSTADGLKSPIFKFMGETDEAIATKTEEIKQYFEIGENDLVLFVANEDRHIVYKAIGAMRTHIAQKLELIDETKMRFVWIERFPFFEKEEGKVDFGHNPFGAWEGGKTALEDAIKEGSNALLSLVSRQYDVALNGYEVLSGAVRNHDTEALVAAFEAVGYTKEDVEARFGHMLEAYSYGAPPHAGFAWGLSRLMMIMFDLDNVRDTEAFPKNGNGTDPLTGAPHEASSEQLGELGLRVQGEGKAI